MPDYLRLIDVNATGPRYDVTPLFADHQAFSSLITDLIEPFVDVKFDHVVGIDALGFVLGAAIALRTGTGFIPVRKGGKLPVETDSVTFVDYTGETKSLELRRDALSPASRVLIVDEWVETGAQLNAAILLVEKQSSLVIGITTINMDENDSTRAIRAKYRCHSVWDID